MKRKLDTLYTADDFGNVQSKDENQPNAKRVEMACADDSARSSSLKRKSYEKGAQASKRNIKPIEYLLTVENLYLGEQVDEVLRQITDEYLKPQAAKGYQALQLAIKHQNFKVAVHLIKLPCVKKQFMSQHDDALIKQVLLLNHIPLLQEIMQVKAVHKNMNTLMMDIIHSAGVIYHIDTVAYVFSEASEQNIIIALNALSNHNLHLAAQAAILRVLIEKGLKDHLESNMSAFDLQKICSSHYNPLALAISADQMEMAAMLQTQGLLLSSVSEELEIKFSEWLINQMIASWAVELNSVLADKKPEPITERNKREARAANGKAVGIFNAYPNALGVYHLAPNRYTKPNRSHGQSTDTEINASRPTPSLFSRLNQV